MIHYIWRRPTSGALYYQGGLTYLPWKVVVGTRDQAGSVMAAMIKQHHNLEVLPTENQVAAGVFRYFLVSEDELDEGLAELVARSPFWYTLTCELMLQQREILLQNHLYDGRLG